MLLRCSAAASRPASARSAPSVRRIAAANAPVARRMGSQAHPPAKHHDAHAAPAAPAPRHKAFTDLQPLIERNLPPKAEITDEVTKMRAQAKASGIDETEDLANHPDVTRIFTGIQSRSMGATDPIRELRDYANTGVPVKEDDVPSPLFFSKLFSVAEAMNDKRALAQAFGVLKEVEKHMLHMQKRKAERKTTDVKVGGGSVPVEIFESAPMQAYSQSMAHINARFDQHTALLEQQQSQVRRLRVEMEAEHDRLREISINELMARYPAWLADIQLAQKEHRWFEGAMEGDDDDMPVAKTGKEHHH